METMPTSMRFDEDDLAAIRRHQEQLQTLTGRPHTPTDVVRFLLREHNDRQLEALMRPARDSTPLILHTKPNLYDIAIGRVAELVSYLEPRSYPNGILLIPAFPPETQP